MIKESPSALKSSFGLAVWAMSSKNAWPVLTPAETGVAGFPTLTVAVVPLFPVTT